MTGLRFRRMFDRKIQAVAPFSPRSEIISHVGISDQAQRQIGVRRAIPALAVRNHFLIRRIFRSAYILLQFIGSLEEAFSSRLCVHSRWTAPGIAPPRGANELARIFAIAARIDDDGRRIVQLLSTSSAVASSSGRCFILKLPAFGTLASCVVGSPAAVQALNPPFRRERPHGRRIPETRTGGRTAFRRYRHR